MRTRPAAALVLAATLLAAGCSSAEPAPAPTATVTQTAPPAGEEPEPTAAGELPQACREALDLASGVISVSNTLIQQFARAVNGDQEAIAALSDPAASQATAQQLSNDQAAYTEAAAACTGEAPPAG